MGAKHSSLPVIVGIIILVLIILAVTGYLPIILGAAYAILMVKFLDYLAVGLASFFANWLIWKMYGPYLRAAEDKVKNAFKKLFSKIKIKKH